MSETRNLRHADEGDVQQWRADFDELDLRMDALRQAFLDGVRSFTMSDETVERIHARFDDVGEQVCAHVQTALGNTAAAGGG